MDLETEAVSRQTHTQAFPIRSFANEPGVF
jgi:hypothetical protein